jgi:hypothetical protein
MISNEAPETYRVTAHFPTAVVPIKPWSLLPHRAIRLLITEVVTIASGGMWVSGRAVIYRDRFAFEPDWISLRMLSGDIALSVPMQDIASVTLRLGTLIDCVDVKTSGGAIYKLRCSKAKSLVDSLSAHIRQ